MGGALKLSARCATPAFVFTANPTLPAAKAASVTESLLTSSRLRESVLPLAWQESVDIAFWAGFGTAADFRILATPGVERLAAGLHLDSDAVAFETT